MIVKDPKKKYLVFLFIFLIVVGTFLSRSHEEELLKLPSVSLDVAKIDPPTVLVSPKTNIGGSSSTTEQKILIENPPTPIQRSFRVVNLSATSLAIRPRRIYGSVILQNNKGDEYSYTFRKDLNLDLLQVRPGEGNPDSSKGDSGYSLYLISSKSNGEATPVLVRDGSTFSSDLHVNFSSEPLAWIRVRNGKILTFIDLGNGRFRLFSSLKNRNELKYLSPGKSQGNIDLTGNSPEWAWIVYIKMKIEIKGPLTEVGEILFSIDEGGDRVLGYTTVPIFSDLQRTEYLNLEVPITSALNKSLYFKVSPSLSKGNVGMVGSIEGYFTPRSQGN